MKALILSLLLSVSGQLFAAELTAFPHTAPKSIEDTQSQVIYYLESDRCHVSAIDHQGKVLWCCAVLSPADKARGMYIMNIVLDSSKEGSRVGVHVWRGGQGGGSIDEKTGIYTDSGMVL
jgi:hypothetical protein